MINVEARGISWENARIESCLQNQFIPTRMIKSVSGKKYLAPASSSKTNN